MNHQITLEEIGMILPTSEQLKKDFSTAGRALTAYATIAQTVQNVGINVPEKWSSRAMCAKTAGIMTDVAGIYGDANVIGIKSRINM